VLVVDASVLIGALADRSTTGLAARQRLRGAADLRAPDLINIETLSGLRSLLRRGHLDVSVYDGAVAGLRAVGIQRMATAPLLDRVSELRDSVTAYDAPYVALSETLGCPLLTADRRLANAPGPRCDFEVI
jgi:predicted nucleic acid-binding protein